jgi:2-polyprenyl-6-hydroxyphenyl methylase/3-demethylubiquinone-9 3-methyltransferase
MNRLNPRIEKSDSALLPAGSAFHEDLAESWSRGYAGGSFRRRLEFLTAQMNGRAHAGQSWLDAGCGTGVLARELAARGASVIAMDASPAMLAHAHDDPTGISLPIRYQLIDSIDTLPIQDQDADGVLCSSVLEYVDDPGAVLREFHRVMRPNGTLILSVPNRRSMIRMGQQAVRLFAGFLGISVFSYLSVSRHAYGRRSIGKMLVQSGFEVEDTLLFSPYWPHVLGPLELGALWVVVARRDES